MRTTGDQYASKEDLPPKLTTLRFGTDIWLKLSETPPAWGDHLLEVRIFAPRGRQGWQRDAIATTDRGVWGKGKLWQHSLVLMARKDSPRAREWSAGKPALPAGRYLVKVYVHADGQPAGDGLTGAGRPEYVGQVEVESAWPEGYQAMTAVEAGRVEKE